MNRVFQVRIFLYTIEEGGRITPPHSGYRPTIFFGLERKAHNSLKRLLTSSEQINSVNTGGILYYYDKEFLLGKEFECFLTCEHDIGLEANSNFLITELIHVVGHGTVLKSVNALPSDLKFPEKPKIDGSAMNRYLYKKFGSPD